MRAVVVACALLLACAPAAAPMTRAPIAIPTATPPPAAVPPALDMRLVLGCPRGRERALAAAVDAIAHDVDVAQWRTSPGDGRVTVEVDGASFRALRDALVRAASFSIHRVADEVDPLAALTQDPPEEISILQEVAPLGAGRTGLTHYASLSYADPTAGGRDEPLLRFLATVHTPPGLRFLLQDRVAMDPSGRAAHVDGARSVLVEADPLLGSEHVAAAEARRDARVEGGAHVMVRFDEQGAARFAAVTMANRRRRIAIVIDGRVDSIPIVMSAILGGAASITMGAADPDPFAHATELARRISDGARLGEHTLLVEERAR